MKRHATILILVLTIILAACNTPEESAPSPTAVPPTSTAVPPTAASPPTAEPTAAPPPLDAYFDQSFDLTRFPIVAPITIHFTQPVNPASADSPLIIFPEVAGEFEWHDNNTTLTFTPADHFPSRRTFEITLNRDLRGEEGQRLELVRRFEIHTTYPPQVVRRIPTGDTVAHWQPVIGVRFSKPMDRDTIAEAIHISPELPFELSWDDDANVEISITADLEVSQEYEFLIDQQATDNVGIPLLEEYRWSFRLKDLINRKSDPSGNSPSDPFTIYFNYEMDGDQPLDGFQLEPPLTGTWSWNDDYTAVSFHPDAYYQPDSTYTLSFNTPLLAANGVQLPPPGPIQFTSSPTVVWARPNINNASPTSDISVRFDRPMNQASVEAAFSISPTIEGSFSWTETTFIFRPDSGYLAENTSYEVAIVPSALDADGRQILDEAFSWSFATDRLPDIASFGYGPNAQVLDASGRRAIQYLLSSSYSSSLTFELYALSLEQFLDRYSSGFKGTAGWEFNPISAAGTTLAYSFTIEPEDLPDDYQNVREFLVPDEVPPGLYLLNLQAGRLDDQLILLLTNNTITVKQAEGQIMAWVTDINGDPVPGIEVGVYARDGRLLIQHRADGRGVFYGRIPDFEEGGPPAVEPLVVVAQDGSDITASGLTREWRVYTGSYWNWWSPSPGVPDYSAYIYTERPIYRPGDAIFFKAILRTDHDAVLSIPPAGTPAAVRLRDARNNVVQTIQMATNDFGSLDGAFQLAEGAMLGNYKIEVSIGDDVHSQILKVEDYRKPDYQVSVSTDSERYLDGDTVTVVIDTEYFFGEPVANAEVTLKRFTANNHYGGYSEYDTPWSEVGGSQVIAGRTNAAGLFTTTITAEFKDYYGRSSWYSNLEVTTWGVEASVDDGSRQIVSGFATFKVFNVAEHIALDINSRVQEPGTPFNLSAAVYDIFDNPVNGRTLTVELRRWSRAAYEYSIIIQSAALTTAQDGQGEIEFIANQPGYYQLRLSGEDRNGSAIIYTTWLYVFSDFYNSWFGQDNDLSITADQESYAPGDTARLVIESTFSGPALLTFERGTTRREMLVQLTAPVTVIEAPIAVTDVPNIYVVVNAWVEEDTTLRPELYSTLPDSRLKTAFVELSVPATAKILNVTIIPDQEVYAPRDEATFTIQVTDHLSRPVSAELSLAMVDEAIFALSQELSGPIYDAFYYDRTNVVRTFDSLALIRYLNGGGMGGGGGDGFGTGNPRSDFQDTAAWFPTLYTDDNGQVQVTVTLPDNLTSWRLTVKAATAETEIGEAITNIITQQPIIIRPILPRTLTAGDTVALSAVVHNYSQYTQTLQVSVRETSGPFLSFDDTLTQTITIAPNGLHIVGWPATAEEAGSASLIFAAAPVSDTVGGDAVQLPFTIRPLAIPNVETQVGQFDEQLSTSINMPAGALSMSQVEIQLSRTIAGSLLEGLDYLTGFPYGCVEQTMSKALPNAVVGRALNQLGVSDPALQADLPAKINAGIQRLYGFQHNDGGWGWWFDDRTDDYQTAWVIFGLATTAEAGYEIDPDVIDRGVVWLNDNLSTMDIRTRAFALYSMAVAGHPNPEAAMNLYERVDDLDTFSQAALALTLHRLDESEAAQEIIEWLAETAVSQDGFVYWDAGGQDGGYHSKTMASDVRSTALALSAFSIIEPGHDLEGGIVRWLMNQRKQQGWGTTNETSFAIIGLTDHLLATSFSDAAANTGYTVTLNGEVITNGSLGRGEPAVSLIIPREQLQAGQNELVIAKSGGGQLYYVVNTTVFLEQSEVEAAGRIQITREYLDPETDRPLTTFEAGQLVLVKIRVRLPEDGSYMIVEDSLPGGLEALNERLNTTSFATDYTIGGQPLYWQVYGYNHKEIFGDRVSFFITEWDRGWHTITYLARAARPGTFTAMPVETYAMYNLALWGRSASHMITVTEYEN